jgi:hypothetical protein
MGADLEEVNVFGRLCCYALLFAVWEGDFKESEALCLQ